MKKLDPHIYLLTLAHFSVDWAQSGIPALLPYFIASCDLNYQEAAGVIFANIFLSSVTQPLIGYYSDKVSKPWLIPMGGICCGIAMTTLAFTTNYWLILFCAMMSGFGASLYHPEAARMVNCIAGKQKGQAIGAFSVGGNAGFAIGPIIAGFSAYTFDIHGLIIYGIFNSIIAIFVYRRMPEILRLAANANQAEVKAHPNAARENDWKSFSKLIVPIFARSVGFAICNAFIPIYWIAVLGASAQTGSLALTVLFSMGVAITFIGGVLADRFGYIRVLRGSFLLMVPAMFLLVNSSNIYLATLLLFPAAFSLFAAYSPIVVLGQTYLAKNIGFASGVTLGLSTTVGGMFAPVVGWGADMWGVQTALQVLWIFAILGCIFSFLVPVPKAWREEAAATK